MKLKHVIWGFIVVAAIVIFIFVLFPLTDKAIIILSGINLFLVYGYILATLEIISINRTNINYLKTASLSTEVHFLNPLETDVIKKLNEVQVLIRNNSDNNALEVKIKLTAIFLNRADVHPAPFDGSSPICIQARHSYTHNFDLTSKFLSRAGMTVQRMIDLANEENEENQFILKIDVSFLDGFGERKVNPQLSWNLSYLKKAWNFIG